MAIVESCRAVDGEIHEGESVQFEATISNPDAQAHQGDVVFFAAGTEVGRSAWYLNPGQTATFRTHPPIDHDDWIATWGDGEFTLSHAIENEQPVSGL
jgi:hypothetical protein